MQQFRQFFRDNFRPKVASGVTSGMAVEWVGMDVHMKFGDSRSKRSSDIRAAHFVIDDK